MPPSRPGREGRFARRSQLRAMEADGLVHREVFAEVPPRVEYSLTPLGQSLAPVIDALKAWGEGFKAQLAS
ncbi:winged helix-turn-helix transcriptional regulator [Thermophilibacter sp. ET337]|uniref:winged helix-turn-helix transcriptional regulator n=1 Tax=Thermophilibacter sp. ET337 TaxID=2973084 RepID=UPI0035CA8BA3